MPTYDYKCSNCGNLLEHFQSVNDKELKKCPKCSKNALKKQIGAGCGIIFKGAGFYVNDYAKKSCASTTKGSCSLAESKPADTKKEPAPKACSNCAKVKK